MPEPIFQEPASLPFIGLGSIDSTNNYALRQLHAGLALDGTAYFANEQLAGKGQRGKTWSTEKNSSILLTVVVNPQPLTIARQFELSACVAVSACEFLRSKGATEATIKWPNDLYWQDRKAGGILIENIIGSNMPVDGENNGRANWRWAAIGIGININQEAFSEELKNPVSLKQITGKTYDPVALAKELHVTIYQELQVLFAKGFDKIYSRYLDLLYRKGEKMKFRRESRLFEAAVQSVTPEGQLILRHSIEESFTFGEVEWLIPTSLIEK